MLSLKNDKYLQHEMKCVARRVAKNMFGQRQQQQQPLREFCRCHRAVVAVVVVAVVAVVVACPLCQ